MSWFCSQLYNAINKRYFIEFFKSKTSQYYYENGNPKIMVLENVR